MPVSMKLPLTLLLSFLIVIIHTATGFGWRGGYVSINNFPASSKLPVADIGERSRSLLPVFSRNIFWRRRRVGTNKVLSASSMQSAHTFNKMEKLKAKYTTSNKLNSILKSSLKTVAALEKLNQQSDRLLPKSDVLISQYQKQPWFTADTRETPRAVKNPYFETHWHKPDILWPQSVVLSTLLFPDDERASDAKDPEVPIGTHSTGSVSDKFGFQKLKGNLHRIDKASALPPSRVTDILPTAGKVQNKYATIASSNDYLEYTDPALVDYDALPVDGSFDYETVGTYVPASGESGFSTDTSGCDGIESRSCSADSECSCYGLYFCIQQTCQTRSIGWDENEAHYGTADDYEPLGTWHDGPADVNMKDGVPMNFQDVWQ